MIGMNKTTSKVVYILFICMLSNTLLFAQNKQGNIVEYFGKEKVDDINEGQLIHTFNKGLVLGQNRFAFGK
jgi:uncharacterized membrane protein